MTQPHPRLFCFGFGYSAQALASLVAAEGWIVSGTCRTAEKAAALRARGFAVELFDRDRPLAAAALSGATHVLVSIPPDATGDLVFARRGRDIAALPELAWLGYLSTTSVYGDHGGGWVDESTALQPTGERGRRRVKAESEWLGLWHERELPVQIFRLAAIYGPGRSPFAALHTGTAKRIDKPGQVFSRIHIDDLVQVLLASMRRPRAGGIYNVCDDEPASPEAVVGHAAELLGMPAPPLVPFAEVGLSATARSFYDDNKRVRNSLIKHELGVVLRYPDYRAGLAAILETEASSLA